jgi:hypothetical protein
VALLDNKDHDEENQTSANLMIPDGLDETEAKIGVTDGNIAEEEKVPTEKDAFED